MAVHNMFYRMGKAHPETGKQPVEKVVTSQDGTRVFEKQGKLIAIDLATFREGYPTTPVQGVDDGPQQQAERIQNLTDEQLLALGLVRKEAMAESTGVFSSEVAMKLATNLNPDLFPFGEGSGAMGKYTAKDVRDKIDALQ